MRKVFHYHIRKCGGTSVNSWMDLQVDESRSWNPALIKDVFDLQKSSGDADDIVTQQFLLRSNGYAAFYRADVVHDHAPIRPFAPAGAFCFTILREPVSRLLSQIADWRRLALGDQVSANPSQREILADAQDLRLGPFLARHGKSVGRHLFDNHLVRALAASRLGPLVVRHHDAAELLPLALASLQHDFDVVGLSERDRETRVAVCAGLGWCPAPEIPRLNSSGSSAMLAEEAAEAASSLAELTRHDEQLYRRAQTLFADQAEAAAAYDIAAFEAGPADRAVRGLHAEALESCVSFSVRQPLVGYGFHGRDGAGTPQCAVWTGPGVVARLYMPVPPRTDLTALLWVRGYADESQRQRLRVRIDGHEVPHRFEPVSGYRDRLAVDVTSERSFLSMELEVHATLASGEAGARNHDPRPRGLSFDRYGWTVR